MHWFVTSEAIRQVKQPINKKKIIIIIKEVKQIEFAETDQLWTIHFFRNK